MPTRKLCYLPSEFPEHAKQYFRQGFCLEEDEEQFWCDECSIFDGIAEGTFPGVTVKLDKDGCVPDGTSIPAAWWKLMKFPPKMEREMKALFSKYEDSAVEWRW
jgi:hypothetical protein